MSFNKEVIKRINSNSKNKKLKNYAKKFFIESYSKKYSYNYNYFGRPIIQYPQDIVALQEIIFKTKPDLIIEIGIAHGGSLILSSSMLNLLNIFKKKKRMVLGIDIDIRKKNLIAIKKHPLNNLIKMIEADSLDEKTVERVKKIASKFQKILLILDSNHTHEHVLSELKYYSSLVSKNSYCLVFDTILNNIPNKLMINRPWHKKNNPMTAVYQFLKDNKKFKIDREFENKNIITCMPSGLLKKIS